MNIIYFLSIFIADDISWSLNSKIRLNKKWSSSDSLRTHRLRLKAKGLRDLETYSAPERDYFSLPPRLPVVLFSDLRELLRRKRSPHTFMAFEEVEKRYLIMRVTQEIDKQLQQQHQGSGPGVASETTEIPLQTTKDYRNSGDNLEAMNAEISTMSVDELRRLLYVVETASSTTTTAASHPWLMPALGIADVCCILG